MNEHEESLLHNFLSIASLAIVDHFAIRSQALLGEDMEKKLAFVMIFLTLIFAVGSKAEPFTVGEMKILLEQQISGRLHLLQGCCGISNKDRDDEEDCSASVRGIYCIAGVTGFLDLIASSAMTGLAFPDKMNDRDNFNPTFFKAGMSLWGCFGITVVAPPIIIALMNSIRNCFIDSKNQQISELLFSLIEINPQARLIERHVYALAKLILNADSATHKRLDAGQALTLSLVDFKHFQKLVEEQAFSEPTMFFAIKFLQIIAMSETARDKFLLSSDAQGWFKEQPALYHIIGKHLPHAALPNIKLPPVYDEYTKQEYPRKISKKHKYRSLTAIQGSSDDEALVGLDSEIIIDYGQGDIVLQVGDKQIPAMKGALSELSKVFQVKLEKWLSQSAQQTMIVPIDVKEWKAKDVQACVDLSRMTEVERRLFVVTKQNLDQMLKLHDFFDIPFLRDRIDTYCSENGVPVEGLAKQLQFVYQYQLIETKRFLIDRLCQQLNTFIFDEASMRTVALLTEGDRKAFFNTFDWIEFYASCQHDQKLLETLWNKGKEYKINEIIDELKRFSQEDRSASNIIAWAFLTIPEELQKMKIIVQTDG